jgi:hypothetical protein
MRVVEEEEEFSLNRTGLVVNQEVGQVRSGYTPGTWPRRKKEFFINKLTIFF